MEKAEAGKEVSWNRVISANHPFWYKYLYRFILYIVLQEYIYNNILDKMQGCYTGTVVRNVEKGTGASVNFD